MWPPCRPFRAFTRNSLSLYICMCVSMYVQIYVCTWVCVFCCCFYASALKLVVTAAMLLLLLLCCMYLPNGGFCVCVCEWVSRDAPASYCQMDLHKSLHTHTHTRIYINTYIHTYRHRLSGFLEKDTCLCVCVGVRYHNDLFTAYRYNRAPIHTHTHTHTLAEHAHASPRRGAARGLQF